MKPPLPPPRIRYIDAPCRPCPAEHDELLEECDAREVDRMIERAPITRGFFAYTTTRRMEVTR